MDTLYSVQYLAFADTACMEKSSVPIITISLGIVLMHKILEPTYL